MLKPEAQFEYGQSTAGAEDGWGDKTGNGDYTNDFYKTGLTWINGLSLDSRYRKSTNLFLLQ